VWFERGGGAPFVLIAVHRLCAGSYLAPVPIGLPSASDPPQTRNSVPDQTAVGPSRPTGEFMVEIFLHLSDRGS
jgi:hypothetical protein